MDAHELTGMYELLDAIEAVVKAADPVKREALAQTIDGYADDFPGDRYLGTFTANSLLESLRLAGAEGDEQVATGI